MKKVLHLILVIFISVLATQQLRAQTITSHLFYPSQNECDAYILDFAIAGCTPAVLLRIYWGDGTDTLMPVNCIYSRIGQIHPYALSGTYTIKMVLYNGAAVDSVSFDGEVRLCNILYAEKFVDENSNCVFDSGEAWAAYYAPVEVDSAGIPIDTLETYSVAAYRAYGPPGTVYALKLLAPPSGAILTCPASGILYDTIPMIPTGPIPIKYFGFNCASTSAVFDLGVTATFRPRLERADANVVISNNNCLGTPALLRFDYSPKYMFDSVEPAYSHTVSGTSVLIDVGSVSLFSSVCYLDIMMHPITTLTVGDTVHSVFTVTPITGDGDTTNNIVVRIDTIKAAWDPNFKSVTPSGDIAAGTTLNYTLEFENTGNDTAHNIHILDTLSNNLDFSKFRGGASSHHTDITTFSEGGYNIVKFDFPHIMLPDSSHHNVCTGVVAYSIKAKSTLLPGAVITNRAGIYFDTNPVVMTNTTYNDIPYPVIVDSSFIKAKLYPNPVHDLLNIAFHSGSVNSVSIYNVLGQQIHAEKVVNGNAVMVNVATLPKGMYYAVLRGSGGVTTIKFDKL